MCIFLITGGFFQDSFLGSSNRASWRAPFRNWLYIPQSVHMLIWTRIAISSLEDSAMFPRFSCTGQFNPQFVFAFSLEILGRLIFRLFREVAPKAPFWIWLRVPALSSDSFGRKPVCKFDAQIAATLKFPFLDTVECFLTPFDSILSLYLPCHRGFFEHSFLSSLLKALF